MSDYPECDVLPPRQRLMCRGEMTVAEFLGAEPDLPGAHVVPSQGLGDTVAKGLQATGLATIAHALLGPGCGCSQRRAWLNRMWPYSRKDA